MSKANHKMHVGEDKCHAVCPPRSDCARAAIQFVGMMLHGKHWRPGAHEPKTHERGHKCADCDQMIRRGNKRCQECNRIHMRDIVRDRHAAVRAA